MMINEYDKKIEFGGKIKLKTNFEYDKYDEKGNWRWKKETQNDIVTKYITERII